MIEYQRINVNRMEALKNPIYINPLVLIRVHLRSSVVHSVFMYLASRFA